MGKDAIYNHDGSVRMEVGWKLKLLYSDNKHAKLAPFRGKELTVSDIYLNKNSTTVSFEGYQGEYWIGWFVKVPKKFKVGDRVRYTGTSEIHLIGKVLKVKEVQNFGMADSLFLIFEGDNTHHNAERFMLAEAEFPNFKELMLDFCSSNTVELDTKVYFDIQNENAKKVGSSYTKADLLSVLRILEKYHVKANISFDSELAECVTVVVHGEDIMEELGNNTPSTLPMTALEELCNKFEVIASIQGHEKYYILGYDCVVYETKDANMSAV